MWETIKTPAYVVDEKKLRENLECLHRVEEETGCHILLAQKAFSMFRVYPLIGSYLSGTTASGLYEARLGYEEMKKENHVFAPAYKTEDMKELVRSVIISFSIHLRSLKSTKKSFLNIITVREKTGIV